MMPVTLAQVAEAVDGALHIPDQARAPQGVFEPTVVSDSRQAHDGSIFVAIPGERVDGHDFVAQVAGKGAAAAIVEHPVDAPIAQIVVKDSVIALGRLARYNLAARRAADGDFTIIGITGSVGKTTTKDLLHALLDELGPTVAPFGSFNNEIGLPLTALHVGKRTRYLIAEMGANHVGEIARLTQIAPPDIAVVLKVGVAHLGEFGSRERIAQAKSEIVRGLAPHGTAVLNAGDPYVAAMARIAPARVLWFGLDDTRQEGAEPATTARDITLDDLDHPSFTLVDADGATAKVTLGISGRHNVANALAAATVARACGMTLERIASTLSRVDRISAHRMAVSRIERGGAHFTLIDDSFNANPDSMKAGLDGLAAWHAQDGRQPYRIAVLGAMLELGDTERDQHRQIGAYTVGKGIDEIIAVGNRADAHFDALAEAVSQGARERVEASGRDGVSIHWVHDAAQADELVVSAAANHADTVVLLKGSHMSGLSALAERWSK
ncbi:UDP-N-acetylmuramoyl-tripeptide--D-alanyl-D-alanine ligase [Bifidobacterium thermophilum]|uniref:UDP-N-acetylmuramoyl-tripeptide--D-alanyl-D- alanine ligase n=1 Tax=Bifidobacterium thermophilum TaxID=33905 RepID=UPI0030A30D0E